MSDVSEEGRFRGFDLSDDEGDVRCDVEQEENDVNQTPNKPDNNEKDIEIDDVPNKIDPTSFMEQRLKNQARTITKLKEADKGKSRKEVTWSKTICTCGTNSSEMSALKNTIREQTDMITKLREELTKHTDENEQLDTIKTLREELSKFTKQEAIDANQTKKRKRDGQEKKDVLDMALISDSHDKEITIKRLSEENNTLQIKLAAVSPKVQVTDKSTEANTKRALPNNPLVPNIAKLLNDMQTTMASQLAEMKDSIQTSIEEKIKNIHGENQSRTYASATIGNEGEVRSSSAVARNDFRTLMMNTKNEELAEENERKSRSCNLIIHGKEEISDDDDENFLREFCIQLSIGNTKAKSHKRIGVQQADRNRPILVQMSNEDEKLKVMNNLKNLKGVPQYQGISIKDDCTRAEREMIRKFQQEANKLNDENPDEDTIYRVRGCPKNGLFLKKFKKLKQKNQQQATEASLKTSTLVNRD